MVSHIDEHRGDLGAGMLAVPSPLIGKYFVMAENGVGGRALEWAMRLFGYDDDFAVATADAEAVAPGAEGVQLHAMAARLDRATARTTMSAVPLPGSRCITIGATWCVR